MARISLGDRVRDIVTGFEGVATIRSDHMTGCVRWYVEGHRDGEGKGDEFWFDESRLETHGKPVTLLEEPHVEAVAAPSDVAKPPRHDPDPR